LMAQGGYYARLFAQHARDDVDDAAANEPAAALAEDRAA
jgi:hypothetical protein